jgi:hypothetical protein
MNRRPSTVRSDHHHEIKQSRTPSTAPPCPGGSVHTVQAGDSWENLAERYGVSAMTLKQANPQVHSENLLEARYLCIPGPLTIPEQHTGRRCIALQRTLTAPDLSGVAYLNYFTNVIVVIIHGLPAPDAIDHHAGLWLLWLTDAQNSAYLCYALKPNSNGLYSARVETVRPLTTFDELIISTGDVDAAQPNGWRVLTADLNRSCGPF